ncbi:MAG: serine/threonine-protein kinase [Parabacteroides sp.]|nr:serine/threonine-protein kinase [Parabacteroides sp.]
MNLPNGFLLQDGKYKLTQSIGQGGFGITYKGVWFTDVKGVLGAVRTEVPVCIKEFFFKDYCYRDPKTNFVNVHSETGRILFEKFRDKLIKEAKILSEVHHPYIVNVLEVFEANNTAYIVMEYIAGQSLKSLIEHNGFLQENQTLKYVKQIAEALDFVHEKHILHLDIKPSNILVDSNDDARLIDFGVSKRYDLDNHETSTTMLTLSKGFASIEQYDNEGTLSFSPCPDIYSLGATMYNMLTGKIPTESILRATRKMENPRDINPSISEKTELVILKAMEISPSNRFQTVREMMDSLDFSSLDKVKEHIGKVSEKLPDDCECSDETQLITSVKDEDETVLNTSGNMISSTLESRDEDRNIAPGKQKNYLRLLVLCLSLLAFSVVGLVLKDKVLATDDNVSHMSSDFEEKEEEANQPNNVNDKESPEQEKEVPVEKQEANPNIVEKDKPSSVRKETKTDNNISDFNNVSPANVREKDEELKAEAPSSIVKSDDNEKESLSSEELDKQYGDLLASGKGRMKAEDYIGAKKDFSAAKNIKLTEEVVRLMIECDEKAADKRIKDRILLYEKKMNFGSYIIVRRKDNGRYGAIDNEGVEKIPCRYLSVGVSDKGRAFERTDNLFDIYDVNGNLINEGAAYY